MTTSEIKYELDHAREMMENGRHAQFVILEILEALNQRLDKLESAPAMELCRPERDK
jgi:hypothetical protein